MTVARADFVSLPETDDWAEARPAVYAVLKEQQARNKADHEHRRQVRKALLVLTEAAQDTASTLTTLQGNMTTLAERTYALEQLFREDPGNSRMD